MDLRWHCVLVHSEIRVWFPPLRVLLLHETGAEQSGIKMTRKHIVRSVVNRGDVLIMTYAGLRCVALVRTSAVTEEGGGGCFNTREQSQYRSRRCVQKSCRGTVAARVVVRHSG